MAGLLGPKPQATTPPPPVVMPDPESPEVKEAARRRTMKTAQGSGRAETLLGDVNENLG